VKVELGATRRVFVFKNFVIKIPNTQEYRLFLHGLLANLQEKLWSSIDRPDLAKVKFCDKLGLFLIMERAKVIGNDVSPDLLIPMLEEKYKDDDMKEFMLSDAKNSNWGYVKGILKKIDYGN
jgi:hypothetical protein